MWTSIGRAGEREAARREQRSAPDRGGGGGRAGRDQLLALADELRDLRRVAVLVDEPPVGARLLERVQVGADHVLGDCERERLAVRVAHLGGHLAQLGGLRGAVAALARDDREAAVSVGRERERRDDPVPLHRGDQLGHLLLAKSLRGLKPSLGLDLVRAGRWSALRSLLASLGEQFERAILERRGFGGALEARLGGRAVGGAAIGCAWST